MLGHDLNISYLLFSVPGDEHAFQPVRTLNHVNEFSAATLVRQANSKVIPVSSEHS